MHRKKLLCGAGGFGVLCSSVAAAQAVPPELEPYVSVEGGEAEVRLIGELLSPDADPAVIEVIAPADARISFMPNDAVGSASFDPASLLDVGTAPEGDIPVAMAYAPDGSELFILHRQSRNIVRFDTAMNTPTGAIPLSRLGFAMDITPDGSRAIIANLVDDSVTLVDLATGVESFLPVGDAPGTVDVSPDGAFAVVGCSAASTLDIIDLGTDTIVRSIPTPGFTQTLSFGLESATVDYRITTKLDFRDNTTVAFPGRFDDVVAVIDIATGAVTTIPVDQDPAGLGYSGDGSVLLVGHALASGLVTVIDAATNTVDRVIPTVGTRANGPVVVDQTGSAAVVSLQNTTRVLDLTTDTFGPALNTSNLNDLLLNSTRTRAIGVGFSGAVIDLATGNLLARANDRVSAAIGAASPTADVAAMASTTFGDDLVVIESDASPALLYYDRSGPGPEGDVSRHSAVSPDGATLVSSNLFSDNLAIFDGAGTGPLVYAPLDERPGEVEISPDGTTAVGVNLDGFTVSIVDLATGTTTALPSARRLAQVEISPDGTAAYVAQVASGDGVRKIDLTTNTFVGGLTATGNLGGVGYSYSQNSQIALSPDGSLLAVAGSFSGQVDLVETATMTVQQTLLAGSFPTRLAWSPDGATLLVSDRNDDAVFVYREVGGSFSLDTTIPVGDQPFDIVFADTGDTAFVLNWGDSTVGRLDLTTDTQTGTVGLLYRPVGAKLIGGGTTLAVIGGNALTSAGAGTFTETREGEIVFLDTASFTQTDTLITELPASMLSASADGSTLVAPSPGSDGLIFTRDTGCVADVNGNGVADPGDFTAWVAAYNQGDLAADANGNGVTDPGDFTAWVAAYNIGC
ncbi:MAG: GC-type dockerin domain-anchored protein [Phycisphaerales bacterium]